MATVDADMLPQTTRKHGTQSRREFLAAVARGGALAGMAALVAALWKPGAGEPDCTRQGICLACPRTPDCPLPAALSFRSAVSSRSNRQEHKGG